MSWRIVERSERFWEMCPPNGLRSAFHQQGKGEFLDMTEYRNKIYPNRQDSGFRNVEGTFYKATVHTDPKLGYTWKGHFIAKVRTFSDPILGYTRKGHFIATVHTFTDPILGYTWKRSGYLYIQQKTRG